MPKVLNYTLTEQQQALVDRLINEGRFHNLEDVMNAGLHLLESREERRRSVQMELEVAIRSGLESGPAEALEPIETIIAEAEAELRRNNI